MIARVRATASFTIICSFIGAERNERGLEKQRRNSSSSFVTCVNRNKNIVKKQIKYKKTKNIFQKQ